MIQGLHDEIRPVLGYPQSIADSPDGLVMGAVDPRSTSLKLRRKGSGRSF